MPQPRCTPVPSHVCIYPPHLQRHLQLPPRRSATLHAVPSPIFYDSLISLNITAPPLSASEPTPYDSYSFHLTTPLYSIPSLLSLSSTPVLSPYLFSLPQSPVFYYLQRPQLLLLPNAVPSFTPSHLTSPPSSAPNHLFLLHPASFYNSLRPQHAILHLQSLTSSSAYTPPTHHQPSTTRPYFHPLINNSSP